VLGHQVFLDLPKLAIKLRQPSIQIHNHCASIVLGDVHERTAPTSGFKQV
jgi:hypothetical protein